MTEDYPLRFKDPDDRKFLLSRSTRAHIIAGHGEMAGNIDLIENCVENPDDIVQSRQNSSRYIYYLKSDRLEREYVAVVVDRRTDSVVTAYSTDTKKS